ncbi:MAG: histidine phosphatase family protein [Chloroflexi bacterium]|nr:histidine phosphatase family protein [Chloroflexota bacterium]
MRTLYLVRHGNYIPEQDSPDDLANGLTALGRRQAKLAAKRLARLPIAAIHHSDLRRAAETAQIISAALPDVPCRATRMLRECLPGMPAGMDESFADVPADELADGVAQIDAVFARYFKPSRGERHEIIVAHGNLIRALVLRALGAPGELWMNLDIHQCGISIVQIVPTGEAQLLAHNDTGHLPPNLLTFI